MENRFNRSILATCQRGLITANASGWYWTKSSSTVGSQLYRKPWPIQRSPGCLAVKARSLRLVIKPILRQRRLGGQFCKIDINYQILGDRFQALSQPGGVTRLRDINPRLRPEQRFSGHGRAGTFRVEF